MTIAFGSNPNKLTRVSQIYNPVDYELVTYGDPYAEYTSLLLRGNGTNTTQNNTFLDSSSNNFTITRSGNTTQGTFSPYGSNWSVANFSVSNFLTCSPGAGAAFGTGDFTVEAWVFATSAMSSGDNPYICDTRGGGGVWAFSWNYSGGSDPWQLSWANSSVNYQPGTAMPINTWNHCAYVRSGTTGTLYLNGQSIGSQTDNFNYSASVTTLHIGRRFESPGNQYLPGYLSNLRIVKGTALYTSNFTPPTSPLTAVTNTTLLTCQSNRYIDNSTGALAITVNGTPSVQRFHPFVPTAEYSTSNVGGSGYWDGTGDALSLPASSNLAMGTGDFTIECWVYGTNDGNIVGGSYRRIFTLGTIQTSGCIECYNAAGTMYIEPYGSTAITFTASTLLNSAWNHFAITRSGTSLRAFVNGTQVGSTTTNSTNLSLPSSATSFIGAAGTSAGNFLGYISDFRIIKGTALYTATFTPTTSPLSTASGTQALLSFTNSGIIDSAMINNLETLGNAQISTTQAKFGGSSLYFDGTDDRLTAPSSPNIAFGTGDFTIEFWMYSNDVAGATQRGMLQTSDTAGGLKTTYTTGVTVYQGANASQGSMNGGLHVIVAGTSIGSNSAILTTGLWYHVAIVRISGAVTVYVNGTVHATGTASGSCSGQFICVGGVYSTGYLFNGYLEDLRITKGFARYSANFTPPTIQLPYAGPIKSQTEDIVDLGGVEVRPATPLLLKGDGTNGAQNNTFLDSSTNNFTVTRNGNTTQGSFSPFGDTWSNYFDGNGDYLSRSFTSTTDGMYPQGATYTIEMWVYLNVTGLQRLYEVDAANVGSFGYLALAITSGNQAAFGLRPTTGGSETVISGGTVVANRWYHIAISVSAGSAKLFLDGTQVGSTTTISAITFSPVGASIGSAYNGFQYDYLNGYISNLRIVQGTALYTANFIPPSSPLTAITNTSLLTCQSNRFIDNSTNNFAITVNGNTSVQKFSPFKPTAAYTAATIGGSAYFDGSGDYLSLTGTALGSGDFTVECWFNMTSWSTSNYPIIGSNSSGTTAGWELYLNGTGSNIRLWSNAGDVISSSATIQKNAWCHVALVRSGSTATLYINGVNTGSATFTSNLTNTTMYVSYDQYAQTMTGYVSNVRHVVGTAVYTSAFTPPTAPVTAITNTSLLLNFTNGGIIDNAMMNNLETLGNAQISTSVKKYGTGSLYFNGSSDYIVRPSTQLWDLPADFTVETFVYFNSVSGYQFLINSGTGVNGSPAALSGWYVLYYVNALYFGKYDGTTSTQYSFSWTPVTGTWYHLAVARSGTALKAFVNGIQIGTTQTTSLSFSRVDTTTPFWIGRGGANGNLNHYFSGYLDDLRVTPGYARYTANFIPPTAALPSF